MLLNQSLFAFFPSTMKMRSILSILILVKCTQSWAESISSLQGVDNRVHRELPHHENDTGGSPKFDIRGWKKTKKESAPSHEHLSIAPAESPFTVESPGYYHGGKGYGKSMKRSKKGSKKSKKSKRGKDQKKKISRKLKKSSADESYDEDYAYDDTELPPDLPHDEEDISAPPSSVPAADSNANTLSPTVETLFGRVSSRTRGFDSVAQDNSFRSPNGQRTDPNTNEGIPFGFPMIQRELYPGPVSLKAHSSKNLGEMETELFEILQFEISGYFRETVGPMLKKYNLEVSYSPGPDTSSLGVIVTSIDITCTLMVGSSSKVDLLSISHEKAKGWIRDFFGGPSLFSFLGELRQNGIDVNEIVFLEEEFQSGLFNGNTIASSVAASGPQEAKNISSEDTDKNKNRVGLFAGIFIGICAVSTVVFVHFKGQYSRELLGSIRSALSSDSDSSDRSSQKPLKKKKEVESARQRSWSGSFRRYPAGGVRPAAIQKQPALSKNFLKGQSDQGISPKENPKQALSFLEDQSFSIAEGDFNIPAEYDFKKSPNTSMQSSKLRSQSRDQDEEFSMPEDYNTVNEECSIQTGGKKSPSGSLQSPNSAGVGGTRRVNPFVYGSPWNGSPSAQRRRQGDRHSQFASPAPVASTRNNSHSIPLQMTSPESSRYIDEWSIDSYDTKTPASQHGQNSVPYRDWHDPPSPSGPSQLDMPHLS